MELKEGCKLISDICSVPFAFLQTEEELQAFCQSWQLHETQGYLIPSALIALFERIGEKDIFCVQDAFQVRFIFLWIQNQRIAFGPYRCEMMTDSECRLLLQRSGLTGIPTQDVRAYRSPMALISELQAQHYLRCLLNNLPDANNSRNIHHLELGQYGTSESEEILRPHAEIVRQRYAIEQQFMESIKRGDRNQAIEHWHQLHRHADFMKQQIGQTMDTARVGASITRTIMRVAAFEAGLPAVLIDRIASASFDILYSSKTVDEINVEHERLIREYCDAIHQLRNNKHSVLVQSVLYYIEHDYAQDLTVNHMAAELETTPAYLIGRFHKETGMTPNAYLIKIRMDHAEYLLVTTSLPIQEISASVGILDANYFAKLFRRTYGETPSNYRKVHKL